MIDVKQAANAAIKYFSALMPVQDVRLEEVELSGDEKTWLITLSALIPAPKLPPTAIDNLKTLTEMFQSPYERVYRIFSVDSDNRTVRSMKIRKVE